MGKNKMVIMKNTVDPRKYAKVEKRLAKSKIKLSEAHDALDKFNDAYAASLRKIARARTRKARLDAKFVKLKRACHRALSSAQQEIDDRDKKLHEADKRIEYLESLQMRAVW